MLMGAELFIPIHLPAIGCLPFEGNTSMTTGEDCLGHANDLLTISSLSRDEPPLTSLPFNIKISLVMALMASLLFGSFFKYIMYSYIFEKNDKNDGWRQRPITVLIYSRTIIHHLSHIWMWSWFTASMLGETPVADYIGKGNCKILQVTNVFRYSYWTIGSLGISVYRVLYIRHEHWVKYGIGQRFLLFIVLSLSLGLSLLLSILYGLEINDHTIVLNMCQNISATHAQILIDYGLSRGEPLYTKTYIQEIILLIVIFMQVSELGLYIWFFRYRYKNDNGNIKKLLTEDVVRARNIKNVTTFLGQFYGFITKNAFTIAILVIHVFAGEKTVDFKAFASLLMFMDFGLLSAVEILSSPSLRAHLKKKLKNA